VCKKLIKNSQPLGKNFQKTLGGIFLDSHCTYTHTHRRDQLPQPRAVDRNGSSRRDRSPIKLHWLQFQHSWV